MSNKEWKDGFEAGISFALTMINKQCDAEFDGIGNVVAEIQHLQKIVKIFEEHTDVKVSQ